MHFRTVLTRLPGPDFDRALTTAGLGAPDPALALRQHEAYRQVLTDIGCEVVVLDPLPGHPDACFVEDACVVLRKRAVVTRPGAPSRLAEAEALAPVLAEHRKLLRIEAPGTVDGGDVLLVGDDLFIGLSGRTTREGAEQLSAFARAEALRATFIEVGTGLHLKSAVNALDEDTLLVTEPFAGHEALRGYRHLVVPEGEEYAANCLAVNDAILVPEGYPQTMDLLARKGYDCRLVDVSEFGKADGGLTCLSIRI
jgi:dimethylargininase